MRSRLVPVVLVIAPLAMGAEQAWPGKGDTVHVAASFKKLSAASPVAGTQMQYDMPPCAPLVVTKATPKKSIWVTKDPVGGTQRLEGAWLARMHKAKAECEAQQSAEGEPNVERSGTTFRLAAGTAK